MVLAMTAFLDDAVGNVTAALASTGLDKNTIVVFVSDNGGPTALNGRRRYIVLMTSVIVGKAVL